MRYSKWELTLRRAEVKEDSVDYKVKEASDLFDFATRVIGMNGFPEERVYVVSVDTKLNITGFFEVSKGTLAASMIEPRDVFKQAILMNSAGIFLLHNHPSGFPSPSDEDKAATHRVVESGKILGIKVFDHLIVGEAGYYSFAQNDTLN